MKGLRKVVWAEGLFLGQHHFQAWDQYQSRIQSLRASMHNGHGWGVHKLVVDENGLLNGRLDIIACQAIFPDGSVVDYQRDVDGPLHFDLTQVTEERLTVSLVLPNNDIADSITGYEASSRLPRWRTEYAELADVYDASRVREVVLAKPNLRLQTTADVSDTASSIPIARAIAKYDSEYELDPQFVPPVLNVAAASALKGWVSSLVDILQNRFRALQEHRLKLTDLGNMSSSEVSDFMLQSDVTDALSDLKLWENNPQQAPFELFKALCRHHDRLALHLAPEKVPYEIDYQHEDPGRSIHRLYTSIRDVLGAERKRPEAGVALNQVAPGRYESSTLPEAALDNCTFLLAVSFTDGDPAWFTRFPQYFKVGAPSVIETMVASALPGLPLVHTQRVPQKVRVKSGYEYFTFDKNSDAWHAIRNERQFAAFCLGEFVSAQVELLVIEE